MHSLEEFLIIATAMLELSFCQQKDLIPSTAADKAVRASRANLESDIGEVLPNIYDKEGLNYVRVARGAKEDFKKCEKEMKKAGKPFEPNPPFSDPPTDAEYAKAYEACKKLLPPPNTNPNKPTPNDPNLDDSTPNGGGATAISIYLAGGALMIIAMIYCL